jgi:hypothetical protein
MKFICMYTDSFDGFLKICVDTLVYPNESGPVYVDVQFASEKHSLGGLVVQLPMPALRRDVTFVVQKSVGQQ